MERRTRGGELCFVGTAPAAFFFFGFRFLFFLAAPDAVPSPAASFSSSPSSESAASAVFESPFVCDSSGFLLPLTVIKSQCLIAATLVSVLYSSSHTRKLLHIISDLSGHLVRRRATLWLGASRCRKLYFEQDSQSCCPMISAQDVRPECVRLM